MPLWLSQPMVTGDSSSMRRKPMFCLKSHGNGGPLLLAKNWNILFLPTEALRMHLWTALFIGQCCGAQYFVQALKLDKLYAAPLAVFLDDLDTHTTKNVCPHCVRWVTNKAVILPFRDVVAILCNKGGGTIYVAHHQTTSFSPPYSRSSWILLICAQRVGGEGHLHF